MRSRLPKPVDHRFDADVTEMSNELLKEYITFLKRESKRLVRSSPVGSLASIHFLTAAEAEYKRRTDSKNPDCCVVCGWLVRKGEPFEQIETPEDGEGTYFTHHRGCV